MKKTLFLTVLFILFGIGSIVHYNKAYLKEDKLTSDIQNRVRINYKNDWVANYKILERKEANNLRIILSSYRQRKLLLG
jgi:hypothetical protein